MLVSQKLAIAAHLHVLLRRKTGRVTDTEWMADNLEYALEIVRFARAKAVEDGHADLGEWADKLEKAALEHEAPHRPLAQAAAQLLRERSAPRAPAVPPSAPTSAPVEPNSSFGDSTFGESGFLDSTLGRRREREPNAPRYVGGIR